MKTKLYFLAFLFLISLTINAQETDKKTPKKPASIYTFSAFSNDKNSFSAINKKLNLDNLNFVYVNGFDIDIDSNPFSVEYKDLGKTPTAFIYDDYKRYQDRNLLKGFLLKNDPTRWNLQYQQQNIQQ